MHLNLVEIIRIIKKIKRDSKVFIYAAADPKTCLVALERSVLIQLPSEPVHTLYPLCTLTLSRILIYSFCKNYKNYLNNKKTSQNFY